MMKKLGYVFAVFVVLLGVLAIVIAMQPGEFHVERKITIDAPPAEVFAQVNDFHKWEAWSPWTKMDPNAKNKFEGAESGKGAAFSWDGNSDVGAGRMTIIESNPPSLIHINLEFFRPMEGTNLTEFTFRPGAGGTNVTWKMSGKNGFIGKAFCMFMDMETMVGGQFEKGLATIKSIVESQPKAIAPATQPSSPEHAE